MNEPVNEPRRPRLDEKSLEAICVAILLAKDCHGRHLQLYPEMVLQDWLLKQFPRVWAAR